MRLLYMGTPQFAVPPLAALLEAGHEIAGVVTRIDKPAGRGRAVTAPPVKLFAEERGLALFQPKRVRDPGFVDTLRELESEAIVVAAYGQILPPAILQLPRHGCINIHASLLPAYRGAAPINWAIIRGEERTGITIMLMDEGMDTGAVLLQDSIRIDADDTAGTLAEKLSALGARLITEALPAIVSGALKPVSQDHTRATLAPLLRKEDGLIDWTLPATEINARVRGFSPWPGAYTFLEGGMVKLLKTCVAPGSLKPGSLAARENNLEVGTGKDLVRVLMVQPAGKKPMSAADFLRGHRIAAGTKFEARIAKP